MLVAVHLDFFSNGDMPESVITISEALKILGCSKSQLYPLLDSGHVQTVERGGKRCVVREGLESSWNNRPRRRIMQPRKPKPGAPGAPAPQPAPPSPSQLPAEPRKARRATRTSATPPAADDGDPSILGGYGFPEIPRPGTVPNLEEQKAWTEFNKRYKTHLELFKDAKLLVFKEDYDKAQNAVIQEIIRQGDILPRIIQQRIPKLTVEDMEEIEDIVREMFSVVSDAEYEQLDENE
jgi:hypothetical protein